MEEKNERKIKYSTAVSIMQNNHLLLTRTRTFLTQKYEKRVHKLMNNKIEGGFEDIINELMHLYTIKGF